MLISISIVIINYYALVYAESIVSGRYTAKTARWSLVRRRRSLATTWTIHKAVRTTYID